MGMTAIEKILARAGGVDKVSPGDLVMARIDTAVMFDNNFNPHMWRNVLKVFDPEKIVVAFDHRVPASDIHSATAHQVGRAFVKKFGIKRVHDIGPTQGISHVVVANYGYALPGTVLACSDSHTCSSGAFNCAARGTGTPDMIYAVTKGETWFRVGETVRFELEGALADNVFMKDVFLHIANCYGSHARTNLEFGGPALATLNMNARRTMTTMGAELSAEFSTFEADGVLIDYIRERNPTPFEPLNPDRDANYRDVHTIRLDQIEPLVALPDGVLHNARPAREIKDTAIDQAFVGSCANGTIDDIAVVARVLDGKRVSPGVRFIVTPGSQSIYLEALKLGYVESLIEAGAVVTNATCGACSGMHLGILAPGETCITASTRNFKGRMGDPTARIYMGSPATVAASAISGEVCDPTEFLS